MKRARVGAAEQPIMLTRADRRRIGNLVEALIALLDQHAGDPDLEDGDLDRCLAGDAAELAARVASELAPEASPLAELIACLCDELACAGASFASARESLKGAGRRATHSPSDWASAQR